MESPLICLGNDLVDRFCSFDSNQALIEASMEVGKVVWIQAQLIENCGMQSLNMKTVCFRLTAKFICFTNTDTPLDTSASHPHSKPIGVMVSASSFSVLGGWLTAKFTAPDD